MPFLAVVLLVTGTHHNMDTNAEVILLLMAL